MGAVQAQNSVVNSARGRGKVNSNKNINLVPIKNVESHETPWNVVNIIIILQIEHSQSQSQLLEIFISSVTKV